MLLVKLFFVFHSVWAGGSMRLTGEVHGFTKEQVEISDGQHLYTVARAKVVNKIAKHLKRGDLIDVTIDVDGILATKAVAPK